MVYDQVEFVKSLCYLEDKLNASGGEEKAMTARIIRWTTRREYGELLHGKKLC